PSARGGQFGQDVRCPGALGDQSVPLPECLAKGCDRLAPPCLSGLGVGAVGLVELLEQGLHPVLALGTVGPVAPPETVDEGAPVVGVAQLCGQGPPGLLVAVEHVRCRSGEVVGMVPTVVDGFACGD